MFRTNEPDPDCGRHFTTPQRPSPPMDTSSSIAAIINNYTCMHRENSKMVFSRSVGFMIGGHVGVELLRHWFVRLAGTACEVIKVNMQHFTHENSIRLFCIAILCFFNRFWVVFLVPQRDNYEYPNLFAEVRNSPQSFRNTHFPQILGLSLDFNQPEDVLFTIYIRV